jgi:uncharacterized RDD family membrane protein YckC
VTQQPLPPSRGELPTATWAHRVLALLIDWVASSLVVVAVIGPGGWSESRWAGTYVLGVFALESAVLIAFAGGSFGQLATRMRVISVGAARTVPLLPALIRQLLVCLVIPPLVFKPDGRGLHDMYARTQTVSLRDYLAAVGRA